MVHQLVHQLVAIVILNDRYGFKAHMIIITKRVFVQ
jgi:hypothetical protein